MYYAIRFLECGHTITRDELHTRGPWDSYVYQRRDRLQEALEPMSRDYLLDDLCPKCAEVRNGE